MDNLKKSKILMLLSNPFNPDERVTREANALGEAGYTIKIIAWDRKVDSPKFQKEKFFEVERIKLKSPYGILAFIFLPIFNLILFFKILGENFDVVHCHDFDTLIPGFLAGKLKRKKIIYDAHEYYGAMIRGISKNFLIMLLSKIIDWLEAIIAKKVDGLITVVPYLFDHYKKIGVKNLIIIYNAKDLNRFNKNSPEIKKLAKRLGINNRFVYLYAGLFDKRRPLDMQINAFKDKKLEDAFFVVIGFSRDLSPDEIKNKIGNAKNIILLPGVSALEIKKYVALADAVDVIHNPNDFNFHISLPNKFFEAVAAGKPIISNKGLFIGEIAQKENVGVAIDFNNISQFQNAILKLKNNKKYYQNFCVNSQKLGEEIYNWNKVKTKLLNFYEKIVGF